MNSISEQWKIDMTHEISEFCNVFTGLSAWVPQHVQSATVATSCTWGMLHAWRELKIFDAKARYDPE